MHDIYTLLSDVEEDWEGDKRKSRDSDGTPQESDIPAAWLHVLPVKNTVLFPGVVIPITVGRDKSLKTIKEANKTPHKRIAVLTQSNPDAEDPTAEDLFQCGTIAKILKILKMPDGNITVFVQGRTRCRTLDFKREKSLLFARIEKADDIYPQDKNSKALVRSLRKEAFMVIDLSTNIPEEAKIPIENIDNLGALTHFIASNLKLEIILKQAILEIDDLEEKAKNVLRHLDTELKVLELSAEIQTKVKSDMDKQQREYILRQQIRAIQTELGEAVFDSEIDGIKARSLQKKWSKEAQKCFDKEVQKLSRLTPQMPDYSIVMNYLECLLDLPWQEYSVDKFDFPRTQKVLDKEHFGLEKVKERIMEYLAVLKLKSNKKAPILCLYGPPGVGKTSLAQSIAHALQRDCVRISLGGVRDEAEIRGHRRTYIGAMPGKILQGMKKSKTGNPVFVLDEIDKVGNDFRGDPASALLEVLDPQQNNSFQDHFLEVEYDLSNVMFIATANSLSTIHPALRDRLEIIEINGYSLEEKVEIAKKHLIPAAIIEHGLSKSNFKIMDKGIVALIEGYTRESGVRKLTQQIAALCRAAAKEIVMSDEKIQIRIQEKNIANFLGVAKFENENFQMIDSYGVAIGLAWTPVGGDILFIESSLSKGTGKLSMTGQLGEVMKESATLAFIYLKTHAEDFQIPLHCFTDYDVHLHIPAGAIPKDGPSAGITLLATLTSLFTQRKVRPYLAMSGEITLRGKVMPVGGIKEKVLAAARVGIQEIILSKANEKDVAEIKEETIRRLRFHYVNTMREVLEIALE